MIIKAEIWKEENTWCASVPALKGCHTCADTEEELKQKEKREKKKKILIWKCQMRAQKM